MIQGNQMKKENDSQKVFNRAQSQKPIVEPLINKHEDAAKTVYWRMNLSGKDDQTVLLQNRDGINADLSHCEEGSVGAVNFAYNSQPSEEKVFQKQIIQENIHPQQV